MIASWRPRPYGAWIGVLLIAVALAALEWAGSIGAVNTALVPPPSQVGARIAGIIASGEFVRPLGTTLYLLFVAYALASLSGVVVGVLTGRSRLLYKLLEPLLEMLRPMPKVALLPPLMLFLGIGDTMKIVIVWLAAFFPVLINTVQGVRGVDPVLINTGRTFGLRGWRLIRRVVLPAAAPLILTGMRVALGLALIVVVIAEMLAGTGGLGFLVIDMQRTFRVQDMYAWVVILAVLGYGLNALFVAIEQRVIGWAHAPAEAR
ncbi:MAG: ABC transporter permease [Burkholderiaceae bacterium]